MRVSGGQQRDSAKHIHVSILPQTPLLFRPYNTEQNSLYYTVWQHFLQKKMYWACLFKKIAERICCQWQNLSFEVKMTVLVDLNPPLRAWKLPSTKRLTQWDRWVILHDFIVLYNEMCQHLEDLHNLVNQYFPNDQCMML